MNKYLPLFLLLITYPVFAKNFSKIEEFINQEMINSKTPAIAVSVISSGKIEYINALGLSDIESQKSRLS